MNPANEPDIRAAAHAVIFRRFRLEGHRAEDIAADYGVSRYVVYKWARGAAPSRPNAGRILAVEAARPRV